MLHSVQYVELNVTFGTAHPYLIINLFISDVLSRDSSASLYDAFPFSTSFRDDVSVSFLVS